MTYDLIVIGAGPAGITAAVYAARKEMNFIVLTGDIGGQTSISGDVENYTGYQFITGPELAAKFEEHMRTYRINVHEGEEVTVIEKKRGIIYVKTAKSAYEALTVIIASGKRSRQLDVPGEMEFRNKGLTYCATCDAPLFSGKTVAVIGGGNSALDAALQLTKIAKKIYLINNTPELGGDAILRDKIMQSGIVEVMNGTNVLEIFGDKMVSGINVRRQGAEQELSVEGVFVEIGLIPNSAFAGIIDKNGSGEIKITSYNETNVPGIFAAGDVTEVLDKQIVIAAGEGSKAALAAYRYLSRSK